MAKKLSEILNKTLADTVSKGIDEYEDQEKGLRVKALDIEKLYRLQKKIEQDDNSAESNRQFGIFCETKFGGDY